MDKNQVLTQDKIIEELNEVLQIDIDAVGAYGTAIDSIDHLEIKNQLIEFRRDHERHIVELEGLIRRSGGTPKKSADFKGIMRKGMTKVAGVGGVEGTLRAMLSNEKLTNEVYAKHVQWNFPVDILDVLRRNYGDEQRHYSWIEAALRQRLWERLPSTTQPVV